MSIKQSINASDFLANVWQKKPLFIERAFEYKQFPLSVDEMAGLACESDVESRLVKRIGDGRYVLEQGPFSEEQLSDLGASNWTLLIQALDHWSEDVFQLLESVDFIPYWRTDDIMVSISTPGGSVGPHYDFYDVFLVQLQGNKTWKIGQKTTKETVVDNTSGLKLIENFEEKQCFYAKPGDVLYIPPEVAHWGVVEDTRDELSVTLSIGFRAPSHSEIIDDFAAEVCESLSETQRFSDASPGYTSPGEIPSDVVDQLRAVLQQHLLSDSKTLLRWFGKYMTLPRAEFRLEDDIDAATLEESEDMLIRAPGARLAYSASKTGGLDVFVNGQYLAVAADDAPLVSYLCDHLCYDITHLKSLLNTECARSLVEALLQQKVLLTP